MAPVIVTQPAAGVAAAGETVTLVVEAAAVPTASYQWFKNGTAIGGGAAARLRIENVGAGDCGTLYRDSDQ